MEDCAGFKGTYDDDDEIALSVFHPCSHVAVLPVRVDGRSAVVRQLFLKMHVTREKCPEKPEYQTLFVVGVPEFCDQVRHVTFFLV